jgi:hypothetical protein
VIQNDRKVIQEHHRPTKEKLKKSQKDQARKIQTNKEKWKNIHQYAPKYEAEIQRVSLVLVDSNRHISKTLEEPKNQIRYHFILKVLRFEKKFVFVLGPTFLLF